jgi:hypothetical protein
MPTQPDAAIEAQLATFIDKFDPGHAALIRECRVELRQLMPTAVELVYDNYNFFVIGYCTTPRASDCIVSIAAAASGVSLSFYYGAALPDPARVLQGNGKQNRFIRIAEGATLSEAAVRAIIRTAIAHAEPPLPASGEGRTVIQSVSAKQRPRRASAVVRKGRTA